MARYEVEVDVTGYYSLLIEADDELEAEEAARREVTIDHPDIHITVDAYEIDD